MDLNCLYRCCEFEESLKLIHAQLLYSNATVPLLAQAISVECSARLMFPLPVAKNEKQKFKSNGSDGKAQKWRENFEKFVAGYYEGKKKKRRLCRQKHEFIMQRLRTMQFCQESLNYDDQNIRKGAEIRMNERTGRELLVRRGTVRVIVPVEDWFDVLFELYKQVGDSCSRTAIYREVRRKFANINRQIVTQFFRGCD
uniref:DUF4817 domain-containing protein n=2 Tax=Globodera pallida TaxID=36090 RepID=A0A183BW62_GLOPA